MKFLIGMVVLALGIYWGARQGYIGGQLLGKIFGLEPAGNDPAVEQIVKNTNARLPRMIGADLSFDRVTMNRDEIILHYRFVDLDQEAVMQKYALSLPQLQGVVIQDICADNVIRQHVFTAGYATQVLMRAQDQKMISKTYVRAERCG